MADGIDASLLEVCDGSSAWLWDKRFDLGRVHTAYPNSGIDLPSQQHGDHVTPGRSRRYIGRCDVFCYVFIPKEHPLHLLGIHPVNALQNAAHPHPWRQGIAAHPNPASVQVQGRPYARLDIVDHGAMLKAAQEKD